MNIRQVDMTRKFASYVINNIRHPRGYATVEFCDGYKNLPIQLVLLHLPYWEIYRKFGIPVESKHIAHKVGPITKKSYTKIMTTVYLEIFPKLEHHDVRSLIFALWEATNYIDDFGSNELNEYHCGISLVELAKLIAQPEVNDIINCDLDETKGTTYIEKTLGDASSKLMKLLGTRGALENNVLLEYQEAGLLNANQIPQVLIAFGLRTEINDKVISLPVKGSSLSGMRNIEELGVEHQGARKAAYYAHSAIQTSQYYNRKEHLIACSIEQLYPGDCESTVTLNFPITAANHLNCVGKNILDSSGKIVSLRETNIKDYIGSTVKMFTAITCRHTDGICEKCFGLLYKNVSKGMNVGIMAASLFVAQVTQLILSTKHFIKTNSQVYFIPSPANQILERSINGIYFRKELLLREKEWSVGLYFKDIRGSMTDLHHMSEELPVPEERYSEIVTLFLKNEDGIVNQYDLVVDGQSPFLTMEFLLYMKDRYDDLQIDDLVMWIPMNKFKNYPIFRTTIENDSMMGFVKSASKFVENGKLSKFKDASAALEAFSNLIYDKVSVNIAYLEILLKAHLITDKWNYSIPIVSDPANVRFGKTVEVIQNRTVSNELALQGLKKYLSSPTTYTIPHDSSPFDPFFGLN